MKLGSQEDTPNGSENLLSCDNEPNTYMVSFTLCRTDKGLIFCRQDPEAWREACLVLDVSSVVAAGSDGLLVGP